MTPTPYPTCTDCHRTFRSLGLKPDPRRVRCPDCRKKQNAATRTKADTRRRKGDRHKNRTKDTRKGDRHATTRRWVGCVGIDGEATNDGRFVMLTAASDDGWSDVVMVDDPERDELSTRDCFDFLLRIPDRYLCWGFTFGYDVNMMLRDMLRDDSVDQERREAVLRRLHDANNVRWRNYRIEYIDDKVFSVAPTEWIGPGKSRAIPGSTRVVWDMFPWVQCSFVKWLRDWKLTDDATIDEIERMKGQREHFTAADMDAMAAYNMSECQLLARGANKLLDLLDAAGVPRLSKFYSPAQSGKAVMRREGVLDHRKVFKRIEINEAIDAAYYGGRSEVAVVGPVEGPLYAYDINSAYPAAATQLPCLAHGRWRTMPLTAKLDDLSLVRVSWRVPSGTTWGPLPVRPKTGSNRWPCAGEGWYWGVEAKAASRHARLKVHEHYRFYPVCDHRPFAYLSDIYDDRAKLKRDGDESQIILKLTLNATYGVLAEHPHKNQRMPPKFRSLMWAGWITAKTRAMLLEQLDDDVVYLATDALVTRRPIALPGVGDDTPPLGGWDLVTYDEMFIAGAGRYWARKGDAWLPGKTRGLAGGELNRDEVFDAWARDGRDGEIVKVRRRFIGLGTACFRLMGFKPPNLALWRSWLDEPLRVRMTMEPRRQWLTDDEYDGRCVAPTAAMHRRLERDDARHLRTFHKQYEAQCRKVAHIAAIVEKGHTMVFKRGPRKGQRIYSDVAIEHHRMMLHDEEQERLRIAEGVIKVNRAVVDNELTPTPFGVFHDYDY